MGWEYNSHIVCMCIIMRWSRNHSASWAERFRTSLLLCTYKLCDYYSPIPILSPFLFTPSLYAPILNLQDFSFTCLYCVIGSTLNYHPETNTIYLFGGFKEGFFDAEVYRVQLQNEWVWKKVEIPEMSIKPSGRYIRIVMYLILY